MYSLFHHQLATGIENVKFRGVNVDLLPGTSSGKKMMLFSSRNFESSPSKTTADQITHRTAHTHEKHMF